MDADLGGDVSQAHGADAVRRGGRWFSEVLAKEVGPFGIKVTALEPGGMQTDWAGSSMRMPPISEPYQPTVGAWHHLTVSTDRDDATAADRDPLAAASSA